MTQEQKIEILIEAVLRLYGNLSILPHEIKRLGILKISGMSHKIEKILR